MLGFVPVMARSAKLMRPFLEEGDQSLQELAARTLHQAKVTTIRSVWKDLVEPLKEEMEKTKQRHAALQEQFRDASADLRELQSGIRYSL